jgi:hypothetical protein
MAALVLEGRAARANIIPTDQTGPGFPEVPFSEEMAPKSRLPSPVFLLSPAIVQWSRSCCSESEERRRSGSLGREPAPARKWGWSVL